MTAPIDTVITAETPEGIGISMRAAGFPVRCIAFLIDAFIRYLAVFAVVSALARVGGTGVGVGMIFVSIFLVLWLYPVVFESMPAAATPGKRAMGIHVIMANGLPLTPAACLIRNLMRVVDMLPLFYGFAIISMLLREDARRLGDLAAGTLVVYRDRTRFKGDFRAGEPVAPRMPLTTRQQAAIAAFSWRVPHLTPERAEEIAALAAGVSPGVAPGGAPGEQSLTAHLVGIARWVHGQRPR